MYLLPQTFDNTLSSVLKPDISSKTDSAILAAWTTICKMSADFVRVHVNAKGHGVLFWVCVNIKPRRVLWVQTCQTVVHSLYRIPHSRGNRFFFKILVVIERTPYAIPMFVNGYYRSFSILRRRQNSYFFRTSYSNIFYCIAIVFWFWFHRNLFSWAQFILRKNSAAVWYNPMRNITFAWKTPTNLWAFIPYLRPVFCFYGVSKHQ